MRPVHQLKMSFDNCSKSFGIGLSDIFFNIFIIDFENPTQNINLSSALPLKREVQMYRLKVK